MKSPIHTTFLISSLIGAGTRPVQSAFSPNLNSVDLHLAIPKKYIEPGAIQNAPLVDQLREPSSPLNSFFDDVQLKPLLPLSEKIKDNFNRKSLTFLSLSKAGAVHFKKVVPNPKSGEMTQRFLTIHPPQSLPEKSMRRLKSTLKIGNPRSYGSPTIDSKDGSLSNIKPLETILNENYVLTVKNGPKSKFGAMAVLHTHLPVAYIGQVVCGARDPLSGSNKPMLGSEKDLIVKGGGTEAVTELFFLAAHLGFSQAKLYTLSSELGKPQETSSNSSDDVATYYGRFGKKLGLDVDYKEIKSSTNQPITQLPPTNSQPGDNKHSGLVGQQHQSEFHYTYSGLERLLDKLDS